MKVPGSVQAIFKDRLDTLRCQRQFLLDHDFEMEQLALNRTIQEIERIMFEVENAIESLPPQGGAE